MTLRTARLGPRDDALAKRLFTLLADSFGESREELSEAYVERLLADGRFWALVAFAGDDMVGGLTAHTLPMTRKPGASVFLYDIAVRSDHRRRGVGRQLVSALRAEASRVGIDEVFVFADNDDAHALDFYRAIGGAASPVTMFDFDP